MGQIQTLCLVVEQVPADLSNDVGKMLFTALLAYALGNRLGRQTGLIVANSGAKV